MRSQTIIFLFFSLVVLSCNILGEKSSIRETKGEYVYFASFLEISRYSVADERTESLISFDDIYYLTFDLNPDGTELVVEASYRSEESDFYIYDIADDRLEPLMGRAIIDPFNPSDSAEIEIKGFNPVWSPNGRFIAFSHETFPELGVSDIYIFDVQEQTVSALEINTSIETPKFWSRDSRELFFERRSGTVVTNFYRTNLFNSETSAIIHGLGKWINTDYSNEIFFYTNSDNILSYNSTGGSTAGSSGIFFESNFGEDFNFNITGFWGRRNVMLLETNNIDPETNLITYQTYLLDLDKKKIQNIYTSIPSDDFIGNFRYFNSN